MYIKRVKRRRKKYSSDKKIILNDENSRKGSENDIKKWKPADKMAE